jgi:hypothetical protein
LQVQNQELVSNLLKLLTVPPIEPETHIHSDYIGAYVIIRTDRAGVWAGILSKKSGDEVILINARRLYRWWAKESISLSAVSIYGVKKHKDSKIVEPVKSVWLQAIEIIPCTESAQASIEEAPNVQAE